MKEKDLSEKKGYIFEERGALADQARAQSFKMNVDSLKRLEEIKTQLLNALTKFLFLMWRNGLSPVCFYLKKIFLSFFGFFIKLLLRVRLEYNFLGFLLRSVVAPPDVHRGGSPG